MSHVAAPSSEFAGLPPLYRSEGFAEDLVGYGPDSAFDAVPPAPSSRQRLAAMLLAAPLAAALAAAAGIAASALGLAI